MRLKKVQQVVGIYRNKFKELGIGKTDYPHDSLLDSKEHALEHCHGMLEKMEGFIKEWRIGKVFRWLGFLQGVLWCQKTYTLSELMNHSRPDTAEGSDSELSAMHIALTAIKKHRDNIHGPDYDYEHDDTYQPEAELYRVIPLLEKALGV